MGFHGYVEEMDGKRVVNFERGGSLEDPATSIPALRVGYEDNFSAIDLLSDVLADPNSEQLTGIVIGTWVGEMIYEETSSSIVEALVAAADQLPNIRAIFLGDILQEENEVSWIQQSDVSPLLTAFPKLEELRIRGSGGLSLGKIELDYLKCLVLESGGMPAFVLRQIASARLPALEHLEIFLGEENYGRDGTIEDIRPLLEANLFPKLQYLGLRDSDLANEVAQAVTESSILEQIKVLDLSLGTIRDTGAEALLKCPAITNLKKLDLHFNYLSDEMIDRLNQLDVDIDVSDSQDPDVYDDETYYYVSVGE